MRHHAVKKTLLILLTERFAIERAAMPPPPPEEETARARAELVPVLNSGFISRPHSGFRFGNFTPQPATDRDATIKELISAWIRFLYNINLRGLQGVSDSKWVPGLN